ncbi:MAG: SDR family NAD(P)-dependent oxidoreductase [Acidimicrobiales bacterium]|nr:SDR family NAD(P)-dependent oxidoreductase [Hyphomonadaceae bacterium]RZV42139.1 MAG: SDR family NAD(P)-dependent oxidoreductase [Acidimicrobiales bacterium]
MSIDTVFHDKICVVTGAASGIGRATAIRLAKAGAVLAISDINEDDLQETAKLAGLEKSNRVLIDRLDVADGDAIAAYADHVKTSLGDTDYVFNIAGLTRLGRFDQTPLSSVEKIMDVNFWGVVRMCKAFLPQVKATQGGFTNISSIFGIVGYAGQAHYCASKFAVRGFSETLAQELKQDGVFVGSVHPGGVATNVARNAEVDALPDTGQSRDELADDFDELAITSPEKAAKIILNGTAKRKRRIIVGRDARLVQFIQRLFPVAYPNVLAKLSFGKLEV